MTPESYESLIKKPMLQHVYKKSISPTYSFPASTSSVLFSQIAKNLALTPLHFINFYQNVDPVATAVDRIVDRIITLPTLFKRDQEIVRSLPIDMLLKQPNEDETWLFFYKMHLLYFLITGNSFIMVTTNLSRTKVLRLQVLSPGKITFITNGTPNVQSYMYCPWTNSQTYTFNREMYSDGTIHYIDEEGTNELIIQKEVNLTDDLTQPLGTSRLRAVTYAILMYYAGQIHNTSLLQQGSRPSAIFKMREMDNFGEINQDQLNSLYAQLETLYQGATNAGRPIINNMIEDVLNFIVNNVDMDYENLQKNAQMAIYRRFNLPLSIMFTDASTYNNYQISQVAFYDDTILPLHKLTYQFLIDKLSYYYNDLKTITVHSNDYEIRALRERHIDELKNLTSMNILSDNEIRSQLGFEEFKGGNYLWKQASMVPYEMDDTHIARFREDDSSINSDIGDTNDASMDIEQEKTSN